MYATIKNDYVSKYVYFIHKNSKYNILFYRKKSLINLFQLLKDLLTLFSSSSSFKIKSILKFEIRLSDIGRQN